MSVIDEIKNKAKTNKKTVVLPETTDMRTLTAAAEVISEGIADIILVGKEDEIKAKAEGLDLSKASFVDPENSDRLNTYIESLCAARSTFAEELIAPATIPSASPTLTIVAPKNSGLDSRISFASSGSSPLLFLASHKSFI